MATMYENVCGNCVDVICMTFHKLAFDFFDIITHYTVFKIA
jgi:hypothetical protein